MTKEEVEANSKCWCFTGITFERAVVYLLAQIASGGGGLVGNFRAGNGPPAGDTPGDLRTGYTDYDSGVIYVQNPDGTWPTLP